MKKTKFKYNIENFKKIYSMIKIIKHTSNNQLKLIIFKNGLIKIEIFYNENLKTEYYLSKFEEIN